MSFKDEFMIVAFFRDDDQGGAFPLSVAVEALLPGRQRPQGGRVFCSFEGPLGPENGAGVKLARVEDLRRQGFLSSDQMHLSFHVSSAAASTQVETVSTQSQRLSQHFGELLNSAILTDITIVAGGAEFPAHRNILAIRAPTFKSMICGAMAEAASNCVEVADVDAVTMRALLHFLYTGTCEGVLSNNVDAAGTWYYKNRDQAGSWLLSDAQKWRQYKISEQAHGGLRFFEFGTVGDLRPIGKASWRGDLSNGTVLTLHLREGTIYGECKAADSVISSEALCAKEEVRAAECWGHLLQAADKYCIAELVELCEDRMKARLNVFNAATMLRLVDMTAQRCFKNAILEFMTLDEPRLRCVKDCREFDRLDAHLIAEVMETFLHPRGQKRSRAEETREFSDDQDWEVLSNAQLRRSCAERGLSTSGGRDILLALLGSQQDQDRAKPTTG